MKSFNVIKNNQDFRKVYSQGVSKANRLLVMYILKNDSNITRFGISVSKKVGNSIVRHRLSRVIRESIRLNFDKFESGYDVVIVARSSLKGLGFMETENALIHVSKIHGILKRVDIVD